MLIVGALAEDVEQLHHFKVDKVEKTLKALIVFCLSEYDIPDSPLDFLTIKGKPVLRRQALLRDEGLMHTVIKLLELWAFKYQQAGDVPEGSEVACEDYKYLCQLCYRCGIAHSQKWLVKTTSNYASLGIAHSQLMQRSHRDNDMALSLHLISLLLIQAMSALLSLLLYTRLDRLLTVAGR